jgi:exoribonuclease R
VAARRTRSPRGVHLDFEVIRDELEIPDAFPSAALVEAEHRAHERPSGRWDATDLPLVTIDPPGSLDLDQALAVEDRGEGWRVHYAIADVAWWVRPGGAVDAEARRRTQTFYAPDRRVPLHPPALGEAAASLLPDGPRPAVLWTIDVAGDGTIAHTDVRRPMVRSRAQLTYGGVQELVVASSLPEPLRPLPALGEALLDDARRRGAIELGLPEQEVVRDGDGAWTLVLRPDLPVERWNAQISLLTGRAAAALMIEAGIGILRTLPPPDPATFPRLRRAARSLGIDASADIHPGQLLADLDTSRPQHAAFADLAAELLRGAAYRTVRSAAVAELGHGGVGAPYAHVTAPLRRLVDRFATEVCLAHAAGSAVAEWVEEALENLPVVMADGDRRARTLDRAVVDATEAFVLADRVGHTFEAHVVEAGEDYGTVVLEHPPVRARCDGGELPLGRAIEVRCTEADVAARRVRFVRVR